jgi:hypothetical protein
MLMGRRCLVSIKISSKFDLLLLTLTNNSENSEVGGVSSIYGGGENCLR